MTYTDLQDLQTDYIDSSDVIKAIEELESLIEDCETTIEELLEDEVDSTNAQEVAEQLKELKNDQAEYEEALKAINDYFREPMTSREWDHGLTMIHEDIFEDHCRERCEDIYSTELEALPSFLRYSIDWESVTDELRHDYSCFKEYYYQD